MASRNLLALVALALLVVVPSATSTHQGTLDVNAHDLNVLVYHPLPDHQGDPWGVPAMNKNGTTVDWMAGFYGGFDFPTAVFDGLTMIEGLPTVEGSGAFQDTYNAYRETFETRLELQAPVSIRLDAVIEEDAVAVNATIRPVGILNEDGLMLRFMLFEDDVGFAGGNGIVNHRFVVRAISPGHHVDLSSGEFQLAGRLPMAPYIKSENVGVVAVVQNLDEDSAVFAHREVLQSASWTSRQDGPTNQVVRGVLLELYSATWCASCVYGDSASDALADEFGLQSIHTAEKGFEYLRRGDPIRVGAAIILGLGALWALRPRKKKEASP